MRAHAEAVTVLERLGAAAACAPGPIELWPILRSLRSCASARGWHTAVAHVVAVLETKGYGGGLALPMIAAFDRDHRGRADVMATVIVDATARAVSAAQQEPPAHGR